MSKNKGFPLAALLKLIAVAIGAAIYGIYKAYKHYKLKKEREAQQASYSKIMESEQARLKAERARYLKNRNFRHYLHDLSPYEFERDVADMFKSQGYQNIKMTSGSSDFGADIIMEDNNKNKYVVEVKKYSEDNLIGRPKLQKLQGAAEHYRANGRKFVTLGYFSDAAIDYAKQNNIHLIDGDELINMYSKLANNKIQVWKEVD